MSDPVPVAFAWVDRPVLVTGATGLLGSWMVKELQDRGALVVALVRDHVPQAHLWSVADAETVICVRGELEDFTTINRALNEYEIDTVFHLGAQTVVGTANRSPLSTFESNIRGTYHVLEASRLNPTVKAVVVASSDKAYGSQDRLPYAEDAPLLPRHPYDASKACADLLAQTYAATYDLAVCVTRCGNLYGPGDLNWNRIIPGTIRSVQRDEAPIIRSDGTFIRDYFYVRDAVLAYLHLAEQIHTRGIRGEAFNFSNEGRWTVLELVDKIIALMDSDLRPVIMDSASGEIRDQFLSAAKAHAQLGWGPRYTIDEGLAETIAWYTTALAPA
ncbi:MAG: NAD-dependent epimerase/dehydratase family protein [Acidimicrobiales bacterium]